MNSQAATLKAFTDAAADSVARAIATVQREALREKEIRDAEYRARLAELDARLIEAAEIERRLADRLTSLKDGPVGPIGPEGQRGESGTRGERGEPGVDGAQGLPGERGPVGEHGQPGERGADGPPGQEGERGEQGPQGERGVRGLEGRLPIVREWADGVHYEGEVVALNGATFQALRDTGKMPPGDDWACLAGRGSDGVDGRSFTIRGTWSEKNEYFALDVVALGGASFAAKRDNPGICPGDGWQLIASQGKRGNIGERGPQGLKGERGEPGQPVVAARIDTQGLLTLTNGDGSEVKCDFYPVLAKL